MTYLLSVTDCILDFKVCVMSAMQEAAVAIFVVTRLVVLITTLRPKSTSGGYLLRSGSLSESRFPLDKEFKGKQSDNKREIYLPVK
jgi:hypothetical protein